MDAELNKLARERAVEKIRKLLAMARDGRGNEHEAARAAEQAEKMMRAYQIEAADVVLEEIEKEEAFERGLEGVNFEGKDHHARQAAPWVGIIAVGVGAAFSVKVDLVGTAKGVKMRFSGYAPDVVVARWVYSFLCETVFRLSRDRVGGQGMSAAKSFRNGAAGVLQRRLYAMKAERDRANQANQAAGGMALVVYGRKEQRVAEVFGAQEVKETRTSSRDRDAFAAGQRAGAEIGIPSGKVVQDGRSKTAGFLN